MKNSIRLAVIVVYGLLAGLLHQTLLNEWEHAEGRLPLIFPVFVVGVLCLPALLLARRTFLDGLFCVCACELSIAVGMSVRNGCTSAVDCANVLLFAVLGPGLINLLIILLPATAIYGLLWRRSA
jgi:hypothetical protein